MDPWTLVLGLVLAAALVAALAAIGVARRAGADRDAARQQAVQWQADLVLAQAERHRSRDDLADALDDGLIDVDASLRVVRANPAAEGLLQRSSGGLVGRSLIEAFLDPTVERIASEAIESGGSVGEVRMTDADGQFLVVRARSTPEGGVTLLLSDVSELRRLQRIRTEFIDNLSHELRTPLTTVGLLAETLTREADAIGDALPPKMRDRIGKIEVETGHLVQMVSELLDLSRIESGSSLGPLDDVDPGRLATVAVDRLRLFAERQGVSLEVHVQAPIATVRGDSARLGQVLINLIHNAVKFSPDGGEVIVAVREIDRTVTVSVTDHGVGIPRAAQDRIFERFYKVDRARVRGETGGTGLGLAIARHVIEQHHGRIWVESTEGVGSTFSFAIPT